MRPASYITASYINGRVKLQEHSLLIAFNIIETENGPPAPSCVWRAHKAAHIHSCRTRLLTASLHQA